MAAFKWNLKIVAGATFDPRFTWKTGADAATAVPVDLTGYTARLQMRRRIDSSTALVELTTENGGIALGGVNGTIDLLMSAAATSAITWKTAVYAIELILPSGVVRRKMEGTVTVSPEVVR